jgi:hypothetical protein
MSITFSGPGINGKQDGNELLKKTPISSGKYCKRGVCNGKAKRPGKS